MIKRIKKGFTLVELVIVIAVVAILASILIPTFTNLINEANESSDISAVRNMNTALAVGSIENKPENIEDVKIILSDAGYNAEFECSYNDYFVVWDKNNNTLILAHENISDGEFDIIYGSDETKYQSGVDYWVRLNDVEIEVYSQSNIDGTIFHPTYVFESNNSVALLNQDLEIPQMCNISVLNDASISLNSLTIASNELGYINMKSGSLEANSVFINIPNASVDHYLEFSIFSDNMTIDVLDECYNLYGVLDVEDSLILKNKTNFILSEDAILNTSTISASFDTSSDNTAKITVIDANGSSKTYAIDSVAENNVEIIENTLVNYQGTKIGSESDLRDILSLDGLNGVKGGNVLLTNDIAITDAYASIYAYYEFSIYGNGNTISKDAISTSEKQYYNPIIFISGDTTDAVNKFSSGFTATNTESQITTGDKIAFYNLNIKESDLSDSSYGTGLYFGALDGVEVVIDSCNIDTKYINIYFDQNNNNINLLVNNTISSSSWCAFRFDGCNSDLQLQNSTFDGDNRYTGSSNSFGTIIIYGGRYATSGVYTGGCLNELYIQTCIINAYATDVSTAAQRAILLSYYAEFNNIYIDDTDINTDYAYKVVIAKYNSASIDNLYLDGEIITATYFNSYGDEYYSW